MDHVRMEHLGPKLPDQTGQTPNAPEAWLTPEHTEGMHRDIRRCQFPLRPFGIWGDHRHHLYLPTSSLQTFSQQDHLALCPTPT